MNDLHAYPTLAASRSHSIQTMEQARERIRDLDFPFDYMCVVALGSYGRFEAHSQASDFEWLLISDDRKVNAQEAVLAQAALTSLFADLFGRD